MRRMLMLLALACGCAQMSSSDAIKRRHEGMLPPTEPAPEVVAERNRLIAERKAAELKAAEQAGETTGPSESTRTAAEVARAVFQGMKVFADTRQQQAQQRPPTMRCTPDLASPTPGAMRCEPAP